MNATVLARHYARLTPEERFRLILAAEARGDEVERGRLAVAGQRIALSMPDYAPFIHAFDEMALVVFIELLDLAASYEGWLHHAEEDEYLFRDDDAAPEPLTPNTGCKPERPPIWERSHRLALATGFL